MKIIELAEYLSKDGKYCYVGDDSILAENDILKDIEYLVTINLDVLKRLEEKYPQISLEKIKKGIHLSLWMYPEETVRKMKDVAPEELEDAIKSFKYLSKCHTNNIK